MKKELNSKQTVITKHQIWLKYPDYPIREIQKKNWSHTFLVLFVPDEVLKGAVGLAYYDTNVVMVRENMPLIRRKFVEKHELYHQLDKRFKNNRFWAEVRANLYPGLTDPLGLALCAFHTLSTPERLKFYFERFKYRR